MPNNKTWIDLVKASLTGGMDRHQAVIAADTIIEIMIDRNKQYEPSKTGM